jgi:glycosyltransferase involved in cell wall biosynthesis
MGTSILLTIHNQERILSEILDSLFKNSSTNVKEYIFVLDGCTDNSERILTDFILNYLPSNVTYKVLYASNVYETKANNIGLREVTQEYVIIVQDDMKITEVNWDIRLIFPMKKYSDIWAVTARSALNFEPDTCEYLDLIEGPVGYKFKQFEFPRNEFYIRCIINRGPLAINMPKLLEVGLFDESMPGVQGWDDVELCYRIMTLKNWKCGSFWIEYYSPLEWGKSRASSAISKFLENEQNKNMNYMISKYGKENMIKHRIIETRIINESEYQS